MERLRSLVLCSEITLQAGGSEAVGDAPGQPLARWEQEGARGQW